MGVLYELNWYLVVSSKKDIQLLNNSTFRVVKSENRVYPLNCPIPIIIKNEGCIGMVKIKKFTVDLNCTEIEFSIEEEYNPNNTIAMHYYNIYLTLKNS